MTNIDVTTAHCDERAAAPSVCFVTLGCAKNEVDSAEMTKRVLSAGFDVIEDPSAADAVVVNTCSFIQAATEESLDTIFDICGLDNFENGSAKLIVAGCMPARYGDDLEDELQEAKAFGPCSREDDIVELLCTVLGVRPKSATVATASAASAPVPISAAAIAASRSTTCVPPWPSAWRRACAKSR